MRTRIEQLSEKAIESGWLLALVLVPLYFNVYTHRVFEPDKLALLRTIVVLMCASAIIAWLERSHKRVPDSAPLKAQIKRWLRFPLVIPVLLVVGSYLLSTLFSVVPRVSLWGSYQRLQGTYTLLSYVALFGLLLIFMRDETQLSRLISVLIVTSLPIALYGLIQQKGLDPMPWGADVTQRVAANMGNAIFLGAYLIMVIPITAGRLLQEAAEARTGSTGQRTRLLVAAVVLPIGVLSLAWITLDFPIALFLSLGTLGLWLALGRLFQLPMLRCASLGAHSVVLGAQLATLLLSGSRGPQVGLLGGLAFFGLVYAAASNKRRVLTAVAILSVLAAGFLAIINIQESPLAPVRDLPYVGRLGRVMELDRGTGRVRVLIWQGTVEMLRDNPWRALVGHGPESMYVAYNRYYPPELAQYEARNATPDRSHNETFDALITTGALGLAAQLLLFLGLFGLGLSRLGLLGKGRGQLLFPACVAGGAALGTLLPRILEGSWRLSGVGLPLGAMGGVALCVVLQAYTEGPDDKPVGIRGWQRILMISLLAAIAGHWIEISVGIAIAATRSYFWAYAAVIALLGSGLIGEGHPVAAGSTPGAGGPHRTQRPKRSRGRHNRRASRSTASGSFSDEARSLSLAGLLLGTIGATMAWNLTSNPLGESNVVRIVLSMLTSAPAGAPLGSSYAVLWMFVATLVVGGTIMAAEGTLLGDGPERQPAPLKSLGICVGLAALVTGGAALYVAGRLSPPVEVTTLVRDFALVILLIALVLTVLLQSRSLGPQPWAAGAVSLAAPLVLIAAALFIVATNVMPIRADVLYKQGLHFDARGNWGMAAGFYEMAIEAAPREDFYWLFAGRARLEEARQFDDPIRRDEAFLAAVDRLEMARDLNPLNTDHLANLGRTYRTWAEHTTQQDLRDERLAQAVLYYEQAVELSPQNAQIYNEWGQVYALLGEYEVAEIKYRESLALDDRYAQTYMLLGDLYFDRGHWNEVILHYERALEIAPNTIYGLSRLAYAYAQADRIDEAIAANEQLLLLRPDDYVTLKNLAYLYAKEAEYVRAQVHLERAVELAPATEREILLAFAQELDAAAQTERR